MESAQMNRVLEFQQDEMTGHKLYAELAKLIKDPHNAEVVRDMSATEMRHYQFWKKISGKEVSENKFKVFFAVLAARLLGLTFTIKFLEKNEVAGAKEYAEFDSVVPGAAKMGKDEEEHEASLASMIEEEFLSYVGAIVLGLNDALVELTGTLAGLTLALQNGKLVAISGLITGIAAAFSMAASSFLASRADNDPKAVRSALYTGLAYIVTVVLLILPYLLIPQTGAGIYLSLGVTLLIAVLIIFGFNFYVSVAKDLPFKQRFWEMFAISMGVAAFSFLVGLLVRTIFGIDI
ncbi:MAG: VIT1/CCC1 family protein [Anaerolineaceae bacterium]|nr:VIT1/CCC1 family protein [Anaerolineaceae bacterium]